MKDRKDADGKGDRTVQTFCLTIATNTQNRDFAWKHVCLTVFQSQCLPYQVIHVLTATLHVHVKHSTMICHLYLYRIMPEEMMPSDMLRYI